MSRCAGLDPVEASWPPALVVVGSQIVVVGADVVVGGLVEAGVVEVAGAGGLMVLVVMVVVEVAGAGAPRGASVVVVVEVAGAGGAVVGTPVVEVVVVGSQIVVVVGAAGGEIVLVVVAGAGGLVVVLLLLLVVEEVVVGVGWAVWRRTGAVRTTRPGPTGAHRLAARRGLPPFPFFQPVATCPHDLAGRWSLARSLGFGAAAAARACSTPLRWA